MRFSARSKNGDFRVTAIAGTRTILMAMDCPEGRCDGFRGFGFQRAKPGDPNKRWLRSLKVFKSLVPDPKKLIGGKAQVFTTDKHPVQSFLWSDYTADPGTRYSLAIHPMYGPPSNLRFSKDDVIEIEVETEPEDVPGGHGVWFNRGAVAGQEFAKQFGDIEPSTQQLEDLTQPITRWLSRGLVEACIKFIDDVPQGEALRACFYEFTYKPVMNALKAALDRGVDVRICHHRTDANEKAIKAAQLPKKRAGGQVLFPRTVPQIPHNKFIVRLTGGKPVSVWTGSTNITASGFLGQTNVGHLVRDPDVAKTYLDYWAVISKDPATDAARQAVARLTPHPVELPPKKSVTMVFSPRYTADMLQWYANRMLDASGAIMFTAAFGVSARLIPSLAKQRDFLRFVLMEKRPTKEMEQTLRADRDLIISYGAVLGEIATFKDGERRPQRIKEFGLDRWFRKEEHFRKSGNVFFVHTKFLLVDPLSDDPLVCTGSANFSDGSLKSNDENMLLIRGDTRVADIYLTEFDRIFRHFYFRDVANEIEVKGGQAEGAFLDETDAGPNHWTLSYFRPGAFKTLRRAMFFADPAAPCWTAAAGKRPKDETAKAGDTPARARPKAKASGKAGARKPAAKKKKAKAAGKTGARRPAAKKKAGGKRAVKR